MSSSFSSKVFFLPNRLYLVVVSRGRKLLFLLDSSEANLYNHKLERSSYKMKVIHIYIIKDKNTLWTIFTQDQISFYTMVIEVLDSFKIKRKILISFSSNEVRSFLYHDEFDWVGIFDLCFYLF